MYKNIQKNVGIYVWKIFIHPSFTIYQGMGQGASKVSPVFPFPCHNFQIRLGESKVFPGQLRYIIPKAGSRSSPGSSPSWLCREHLHRHPYQTPEPPQPIPFNERETRLYFEVQPRCLSSSSYIQDWAQPHSRGISLQPQVSVISFFRSVTKAQDHTWVLEQIWCGKQSFDLWLNSLFTTTVQDRVCNDPLVYLSVHFTLTCDQDPKILNSSCEVNDLFPTLREQSTLQTGNNGNRMNENFHLC